MHQTVLPHGVNFLDRGAQGAGRLEDPVGRSPGKRLCRGAYAVARDGVREVQKTIYREFDGRGRARRRKQERQEHGDGGAQHQRTCCDIGTSVLCRRLATASHGTSRLIGV